MIDVKKFIDMPKYMDLMTSDFTRRLAETTNLFAKRKVSYATGELARSIRTQQISPRSYIVFSDLPYAKAQEWGLAPFGKPGYRFTPYMRPAANAAGVQAVISGIARIASNNALVDSRI